MRIFEVITYNLKEIRFKDTKDYFDNLFKTLNFSYEDIMVHFSGDSAGDICKKVVRIAPALSEYIQHIGESEAFFGSPPDYCFSSIKRNKDHIEKYIKKDHVSDFDKLLKKIPFTVNFAFMGVVLDNINWYGNETQDPVFYSESDNILYYSHTFESYFSNSVRFKKEFDFGNKFNLVNVVIERKIENGLLKDYPDNFKMLLEKLGMPKDSRLKCVFPDSEKSRLSECSRVMNEFIAPKRKNEKKTFDNELPQNEEGYFSDSVTPVSGYSPKAIFNKYAKKSGYKYLTYKYGGYFFESVNCNNHMFLVEIINYPFSLFFSATIYMKGYNFRHIVYGTEQVTLEDAAFAEIFAKRVFEISKQAEECYGEKALSLYGKTPGWYIDEHSKKGDMI